MRRRLLLVLLALGSFFGFAAGFSSWRWHQEHGWGRHGWGGPLGAQGRLDAMAEACVRAAERVPSNPGTAPLLAPNPAPP
jgi:hypothetical protein